jgi:hypothetical protein
MRPVEDSIGQLARSFKLRVCEARPEPGMARTL